MKRKFKLFATVASLCLCLALMAFGVYAASSVTYTAKGSVKYSFDDGNFVSVSVSEVKQNQDKTAVKTAENLKQGTFDKELTGWNTALDVSNTYKYEFDAQTIEEKSAPEIDFNDGYAVTFKIKVTRDKALATGKKSVVSAKLESKSTKSVIVEIVNPASQDLDATVNSSVEYTCYIGLSKLDTELATGTTGWTLEISVAAPSNVA